MNAPTKNRLNVLYVETYGTGSHGRILDLLQAHSRHAIEDLRLDRGHWRWLAIAAHYEIADAIAHRTPGRVPDLLVLSGPLDVTALMSILPREYRDVPKVAYFHESQWTYPAPESDPRPYLLQHLNTASACDEIWFNSRFHLDAFWSAATANGTSDRIQRLARRLRRDLESRCLVVYPPVSVEREATHRATPPGERRIVWNARWENDKRPDRFVALLDTLARDSLYPDITILGTAGKRVADIQHDLGEHASRATIPGDLASRSAYVHALASADILVSTADHEFFGVAALEAALCGVMPVLPASLAYPETLPSAFFYPPDDIDELTRIVALLLAARSLPLSPVRIDASRFLPQFTVPVFDDLMARIVERHRP